MNNTAVSRLLKSGFLYYTGMVILTSAFWQSGLTKLFDVAGAQGEMAHFGLKPAAFFAAGTIVVQLGASALLVFGKRLAWIGAGALAAFTLATVPIAHAFWRLQGQQAYSERMFSNANFTIVGGLLLAAIAAELRHGAGR